MQFNGSNWYNTMLIRRHPIDIIQILPKRVKSAHKGSVGRLLIMAGSDRYTGAASLMVQAALRAGIGIVYVVAVHSVAQVIRFRTPEAVVIDAPEINGEFDKKAIDVVSAVIKEYSINALGIGPGIGQLKQSEIIYNGLYNMLKGTGLPALIDANALGPMYDCVSAGALPNNQLVFTPHPKEFLQMTHMKELTNKNKDVLDACKKINQVIVYKDSASVVASAQHIWPSCTGNESLATAGSGDVLSGIISSFLGQNMAAFDAAKLGVYVQGLVAEMASHHLGVRSVIASDLCDYLPKGFQELLQYHG
jgi:hydroxyethylthiazole kinase-like uncharacterized protein yjeF